MVKRRGETHDHTEEHTTVTKGTRKKQAILKAGTPVDHSAKHIGNAPQVGVSIGMTLNMDNYESLRVDCWETDIVREGETDEQAYQRIYEAVYRRVTLTAETLKAHA